MAKMCYYFAVLLISFILGLGQAHYRYLDDTRVNRLQDIDENVFDVEKTNFDGDRYGEVDDDKPGPPISIKDLAYAVLYVNGAADDPKIEEDSQIGEDPTLNADLFEGDITGVKASDMEGRNAVVSKRQLWHDAKIPYTISEKFSKKERAIIAEAMEHIHKHTCIKFVPLADEKDHIVLKKGSGCSSAVGRSGGKQEVSLGGGCVYKGIVVHELTHSIGFWHEQSRPDRDDHVIINWPNIKPGMEHNFRKYDRNEASTQELDYDVNSIMHYGPYSFAVTPSGPSIQPRTPRDTDNMGQRVAYTDLDIKKVNRLYNCHAKTRTM